MHLKIIIWLFSFFLTLNSYSAAKEKYLFLDAQGRTHSSDELERDEFSPSHPVPMDKELQKHVLDCSPQNVKDQIRLTKFSFKLSQLRYRMFVGKEGTGKKTMAQTIAAECNLPCYIYNGEELIDQYKSSGPQNLSRIFDHAAQNQPCAVIIHNLDTVIKRSGDKNNYNSTFVALKNCIEENQKKKILFIGTHDNRDYPDYPGCFFSAERIEIPTPNIEQRKKIIEYYHRKFGNEYSLSPIISTQKLADKTKYFTPRELKYLTNNCTRAAVLKLNHEHEQPVVTQEIYDQEIAKARKRLGYEWWHEKATPYVLQAAPYALVGVTALGALAWYKAGQAKK